VAGRWVLLAVLTASYGAGAFGVLGISPLAPSLGDGFALSRLQVALIVPSVYLGGLFFSMPGGRLADGLGVRKNLLGGLAVAATGLLVGAWSPTFPDLESAALRRSGARLRPYRDRSAGSPARGAVSRLALGAASDRWLTEQRALWPSLTAAIGAVIFIAYAAWPVRAAALAGVLAFASGVGAYGWVGVFFTVSAEVGGRHAAGVRRTRSTRHRGDAGGRSRHGPRAGVS
jgi:MFS family permease